MPEHIHLLITEPERAKLGRCGSRRSGSFWQARYYDFNVWTEAKRIEKLRYTSS
jgi:putative transposase